MQFVEHEVNHEFEKAKRCIFTKDRELFQEKNFSGQMEDTVFHPVFLSSLLNQQVQKRDVAMQLFSDQEAQNREELVKIYKYTIDKERKETNKKITESI